LQSLDADLWISSLRRCDSAHRKSLEHFEVLNHHLVKAYPLLDWCADDLDTYLHENDLPKGPDCYDPTKGEPMKECGLHTCMVA